MGTSDYAGDELAITTEANSIAALALKGAAPTFLTGGDGRQFLVSRGPEGEKLYEVPSKLPTMVVPGRVVQSVTIETALSLVDYAGAFASDGSRLFANIDADRIVAILDYHKVNESEEDGGKAEADFGEHRATLQLVRSMEWKAWTGADGKLVPQLEFVNFLEENREDIVSPVAADLLEVVRDLQTLRKVDFRSVVREGSENYKIEYANDENVATRTQSLTLPTEFLLTMPVYFGSASVSIYAMLRWKISDDNKLLLGFKLKRAERIRQAEFQRIVTEIGEASGLPAIYGKVGS